MTAIEAAIAAADLAGSTPSGLGFPGHEIRITKTWDLACQCGVTFLRTKVGGVTQEASAMRDAARKHLARFSLRALTRRRESEERRILREIDREVRDAHRLKTIHGEKLTRELAEQWEISRSAALRYLHNLSGVKKRRDRSWPHGYLWSRED